MKSSSPSDAIIRTHSGQLVNLADPDPRTICLEDISWALSNICRYTGHTDQFYSVGQHCLMVLGIVERRKKNALDPSIGLMALLHDASEAYLTDVSSPLKQLPQMAGYRQLEALMIRRILESFGVDQDLAEIEIPEVRAADKDAALFEMMPLFGNPAVKTLTMNVMPRGRCARHCMQTRSSITWIATVGSQPPRSRVRYSRRVR